MEAQDLVTTFTNWGGRGVGGEGVRCAERLRRVASAALEAPLGGRAEKGAFQYEGEGSGIHRKGAGKKSKDRERSRNR